MSALWPRMSTTITPGAIGRVAPRRQLFLQQIRIHVPSGGVGIQENGLGLFIEDGIGRGTEGEGGTDDFAPRIQTQSPQRQMQCGRAADHGEGVVDAHPLGKLLLKLGQLRTHRGHPVRCKHLRNPLLFAARHMGRRQVDARMIHRRAVAGSARRDEKGSGVVFARWARLAKTTPDPYPFLSGRASDGASAGTRGRNSGRSRNGASPDSTSQRAGQHHVGHLALRLRRLPLRLVDLRLQPRSLLLAGHVFFALLNLRPH